MTIALAVVLSAEVERLIEELTRDAEVIAGRFFVAAVVAGIMLEAVDRGLDVPAGDPKVLVALLLVALFVFKV